MEVNLQLELYLYHYLPIVHHQWPFNHV